MTRSATDIIAEFLWRELFGHDTRLDWARLSPDKQRPFESRADEMESRARMMHRLDDFEAPYDMWLQMIGKPF